MQKRKIGSLEVSPIDMGCMGFSHGYGAIPSESYSVAAIQKAHEVCKVAAVQNLYNMMERDCETEVFPYCLKEGIALVSFSPIAGGLLSGKINATTQFEKVDDVRNFLPQLSKENLMANLLLVDALAEFAAKKGATSAQIALAWQLKKYPNAMPIPGSKNQQRILENLAAWKVILGDKEFCQPEQLLSCFAVHGHRGTVEYEGNSFLQRESK